MDNVCIICREEMVTGAKRLPCNHIFHTRWGGAVPREPDIGGEALEGSGRLPPGDLQTIALSSCP